ncbi:ABC transporter substrate-binding protein [Gordoniibacillus kamchatkensis]|uniref:ABC transporter substrate-binding protein n=1 Tax=Gordoniibacillus kamchatkensis TaxID=1590651 RepID=A0ABR5AQ86_9BACL|nr:extracellular solute-binding protein [Paenibacillus sp. VKM B-2647]KIL42522.1 ABC transporter substrate-binding protein [Paenibacillus sp. VKM B-2647]
MKVKQASLSLAVLLAGSVALAACSNSGKSGAETGNSGSKQQVTEITMNTLSYATEFPDENDVILKEFEKRTNTKLKIDWVPVTTSDDKFNVLYASGNLPDLTFVEDLGNQQIRSMIDQGVFWDLTPFIKDYKNLSNPAIQMMWDNSKINGKNYSIPRFYPTHGGGVFPMLRKDWLDKLGLKPPQTMDQFFDVLKAFKDSDADGNGKKDTVPYSSGPASMGFVYGVYNETQGDWKLKDGKLVPVMTEDASRDALLWIKKAYDAGLFPNDFAILKTSQLNDLLLSGKAGGQGFAMNNAITRTIEIRKVDPKADLIPLTSLKTANGAPYTPSTPGFYGHFLIPKKVPEAKVRKLLQFMDYGYSPEGNELANYGIKDVHFKLENGKRVLTDQFKKDKVDIGFQYIFLKLSDEQVLGDPSMADAATYARNQSILDERKKINVPNPAQGLVSDANTKLMPDIKKKVDDMRIKVILGQEKIEAYDDFIKKLKDDPNLQKVTKEMNEVYAQAQKNK